MDYKAQVIANAEEKFQNMLSGNTEPLIRPEVKVADSSAYSKQRGATVRRLAAESIAFDRAIDEVRRTRKAREDAENQGANLLAQDKSKFAGVTWVTVLHVILMAAFAYACLALNMQQWVKDVAIKIDGLEFFFGFLDGGYSSAPEWLDVVSIGTVVVGTIAMIIIFFSADTIEGCGTFVFYCLILSPLCGSLAAILIRGVIALLSNVLYFLLMPYGALVFGVAAMILAFVVGAGLETPTYKGRKWLCALGCLAVSVVVALIGFAG